MDNWDLTERQIQQRLSEEEKIQSDNLSKNDAEYRNELEKHLIAKNFIEQYQTINEFEKHYQKLRDNELRKQSVKFFLGLSSAAATIILFLYFSFTDVYRPDLSLDSGLVMQIETPNPITTLKPEQKKAFESFTAGQFYMTNGEFDKAILSFNESLKVTEVRQYFREATIWHLCIAYLKAGKLADAQKQMDEISSWDSPKYTISNIDRWKLSWQIYLRSLFE